VIILYPDHRGAQAVSRRSSPIVLFGVGLIGSAIRDSLLERGYRFEEMPLSWVDAGQQQLDLESIGAHLESLPETDGARNSSFIWSAGRAGFSSDDREVAIELESFRRVLAFADSLAGRNEAGRNRFMMVGSIGGLFEGQRHIELDALPRALRPYGRLKLEQESLLTTTHAEMHSRVYRLTSVFGPSGAGRRKGLVSTLIGNCFRHETTTIIGTSSTLRDFVWSRDIGNFIARDAVAESWSSKGAIKTLGSGRPASIQEIIQDVETSTGLKALIRFEAEASNSSDITLASNVLPKGWLPTDLGTAIRRTCLEMTAS
jgi:nucleoside-diphosphate-sugar epimerase